MCHGYELITDLDFDENGNGVRDDTYNTGAGWRPIMGKTYPEDSLLASIILGERGVMTGANVEFSLAKMFHAVFEGNGHTISNLYVNHNSNFVGLFGWLALSEIRNIGLIAPTVRGKYKVGA